MSLRDKLFQRKPKVDTLMDKSLDAIILSHDPKVYGSVWEWPDYLVDALDKRCVEIENTKEYKRRFGGVK